MLSSIRTALSHRITPTHTLRTISTTPTLFQQPTSSSSSTIHTTDTYAKEVDTSPAPDETIHVTDPSNVSAAQKPNKKRMSPAISHAEEAADSHSGRPKNYESVQTGKDGEPYAPNGGQDRRYGGKETYEKEKGPETSHKGQGPAGSDAAGRGQ